MTFTRTSTATRTFTRMDLMRMQIQRVLMRCRVEEQSMNKLLQAVTRKWIREISLYGLDGMGKCVGELFISINWAKNELHVAAGRNTVTIDERWENDVSIEVEMALNLFEDLCRVERLSTIWHCRYRDGIDGGFVNNQLGFKSAAPVEWRGGYTGTGMSIPELDEFTVGVRIVG